MKLYTLTIPENIAPGRLFPWLRRMLPQLPEYAGIDWAYPAQQVLVDVAKEFEKD